MTTWSGEASRDVALEAVGIGEYPEVALLVAADVERRAEEAPGRGEEVGGPDHSAVDTLGAVGEHPGGVRIAGFDTVSGGNLGKDFGPGDVHSPLEQEVAQLEADSFSDL